MSRRRTRHLTRYCVEIKLKGKWHPWSCGNHRSMKSVRKRLTKSGFGRTRLVKTTLPNKVLSERGFSTKPYRFYKDI